MGKGDDLRQFLFQRGGWRLGFEKQLGLGEDAFAHHAAGVAPGLVERGGLPRGPRLRGEGLRHPLAVVRVDARHRRQETHGDLGGDFALAYLLLHRFGQQFHQRQAARHPGGAAIETPRQSFDRTVQPAFHLRQQPALFERGLRLAHPQRALQHQRFGFAHRPHDGLHRVAPQLLERGDAFVAVDDQIATRVFDDDDGRLLPGFSQ